MIWPPPWKVNSVFRWIASVFWVLGLIPFLIVLFIAGGIAAIVSRLTGRKAKTCRARADVYQIIERYISGSLDAHHWDHFLSHEDSSALIEKFRSRCVDVCERFPPEESNKKPNSEALDELRQIANEIKHHIDSDPVKWPAFIKIAGEADLLFVCSREEWDFDVDLWFDSYDKKDRVVDTRGRLFRLDYPEGATAMHEKPQIIATDEFLSADQVKQLMLDHLEYNKHSTNDYLDQISDLSGHQLIRESITRIMSLGL